MKKPEVSKVKTSVSDISLLGLKALKRAAKRARETAKMHGTKLYFLRDGKIVAEKP